MIPWLAMPDFSEEKGALISEIFSSIQGEGLHMGERHLFIRFASCNVRCEYCDEAEKPSRIMTVEEVFDEVIRLDQREGPHRFIALTGGEPLLEPEFLKQLIAKLKSKQCRVLLETNGIEWRALTEILESCDSVSMDMKLASVGGHRDYFEEHGRFLAASKGKEMCVKIVVSKDVDLAEFERHLDLIADTNPEIPVFIQSVWQEGFGDGEFLAGLIDRARQRLKDVRLGFQLHKLLHIK